LHRLNPAGTVFRSDFAGSGATTASAEVLAELPASIPAFECVLGKGAFSSGSFRSALSAIFDRIAGGPRPA
jgi:hypothetical protein